MNDKVHINTYKDIDEYLKNYKDMENEAMIVILLDKNEVIEHKCLSQGDTDQIRIHPKEIFNYALENNANNIILAHNHPSNNPLPSTNDINSTITLKEISNRIGINLVDHVILTKDDYFSMNENCSYIFKNHRLKDKEVELEK